MPGRSQRQCRDVEDVNPSERLNDKVVRVDPVKSGRLVHLEFSLGGPTLLITAFVQVDESHPVGSTRHFLLLGVGITVQDATVRQPSGLAKAKGLIVSELAGPHLNCRGLAVVFDKKK